MANAVYQKRGTPITFKASGGTVTFTPSSTPLPAGDGRISAQHDLGTSAAPMRFEWRAKTAWNTSPVVGESVDIYLCTSDGTIADGDFGTSDADFTDPNLLLNLEYIGSITADLTTVSEGMKSKGRCEITSRYVQVVFFNNSAGDALENDSAAHEFILTPIYDEIQ